MKMLFRSEILFVTRTKIVDYLSRSVEKDVNSITHHSNKQQQQQKRKKYAFEFVPVFIAKWFFEHKINTKRSMNGNGKSTIVKDDRNGPEV